MIDWQSEKCQLLLNPRTPAEEARAYRERLEGDGSIPGHLWLATSGTSGRQKFVALSRQALLASARAVNVFFDCSASDRWLQALPSFHVGGLGVYARAHLSSASLADFTLESPGWSPEAFCAMAEDLSTTMTALVPTQLYDIIERKLLAPKSLRATIVGGGALCRELYIAAKKLGWSPRPSYGTTECSSQVATAEEGEYGSYTPLNHIQIKIDDRGYICLKSPSLFTQLAQYENGHWSFMELCKEGWWQSEDRGSLDERGKLIVYGRDSHFVKVGGESVNLLDLQMLIDDIALLEKIPLSCRIYAEENQRLGMRVALEIEGGYSEEVQRLVTAYQTAVMPFQRISRITFAEVIARNAMGKVILS